MDNPKDDKNAPIRHALGTWGEWLDEAEARITEAGPKAIEAIRREAHELDVDAQRDDSEGLADSLWEGHPGWAKASVREAVEYAICCAGDDDEPTDDGNDEVTDANSMLIRVLRLWVYDGRVHVANGCACADAATDTDKCPREEDV